LGGQGEDFEGCAKKLESAQGHTGHFFCRHALRRGFGQQLPLANPDRAPYHCFMLAVPENVVSRKALSASPVKQATCCQFLQPF
jgi:hypothetical protein